MPFRHNKKRNTGLVYEFLVRQAASYIIEEDRDGCQRVLSIVNRQFGRTPMGAELKLFDMFRNSRGLPEQAARKVLFSLAQWAKKIDRSALSKQKGGLIKEINYTFGKKFFDAHRVPEYKALASFQIFLDSCREGKKKLDESVDSARLEEGLVMFMSSKDVPKPERSSQEVDGLVCAIAIKKFNEKYGSSFTNGQREMLQRYTRAIVSEKHQPFVRYLNEKRKDFIAILGSARFQDEFKEDPVMLERLGEARRKLDEMNITEDGSLDALSRDMMLYDKLVEEINNNG